MPRRLPWRREETRDRAGAEHGRSVSGDIFSEPAATEVLIVPTGSRLGEILLAKGAIERDQLVNAIREQGGTGRRLGSILVTARLLSDEELADALIEQAGVERVDLSSIEPDEEAAALLSEAVARELNAVPIRVRDDGTREFVVSHPDSETRQRLEKMTGGGVHLLADRPDRVRLLLNSVYRVLGSVPQFVERFEAADAIRTAAEAVPEGAGGEDVPVIQVVNLLITQALRDRASDIHIEPQSTHVRLRYRVDGAMHDILELPASMALALVSRLKIMADLSIVERRRPQDGQIAMMVEGHDLNIRIAIAPTIFGEKVVLRLLDKSRPLFRYTELGMSDETAAHYIELVHSPFGMVVCSGPTGSGKTTTLYATLLALNNPELNITTIEDPVEYVMPGITQIQINPTTDVTFATGLRSILRQDPDIILVGEIRDTETARIAVRSALTGHLVLSSIHATDAASSVQRFLDMGIEPFLLASSLAAVVAQRLVRRICTYCKVPYAPTAEDLAFYDSAGGAEKTVFMHGGGCTFCSHTGYLERIGVYELLELTEDIRAMVVAGVGRDAIRNQAINQHGMRTLRQEGLRLVSEDVTTISEVVRQIWTM
ncbi:MAG: type II/IV secretion system protein [Acidobacteria bacterium]|nr:type II/IV secretion system protein [Acidobacteriota bacterium]